MAKTAPERPVVALAPLALAVVASEYNREYVDGLLSHFEEEMAVLAPSGTLVVHRVPGAFEIPLAVQELAEQQQFAAVVAFGVIIAGATAHADLIAETITAALMQVALAQRTPIIHEVLLVRDEAQARERCGDGKLNRGAEAARAAVRMVDALRAIRG